ncbi:MAG: tetratricopeptide repeat protein [Candidatus Aminicenantes bacterium]
MSRKKHETHAEKYIKKGKFKEAIKEYQNLLEGGDQDIPIRNTLGDLYIQANLKEEAVEEFRKIALFYDQKKLYAKSIALYKKITRLKPDEYKSAERLADLLREQGFISEAKTEYQQLARRYTANAKTGDAVRIYSMLLVLDKEDTDSRIALVDLYQKDGHIDQAVGELNELAEIKMAGGRHREARQLLDRARGLQDDHFRTLSNLIEVLKREKKDKEALDLVRNVLKRDKDNIEALRIYGNLLYSQKDYNQAKDIFAKVLSFQPGDNTVRIRLGKIFILEKKYDEAFSLFEPLVEAFLKKNKENKAISLLGLIVETQVIHLPTLEKLGSIYKHKAEKENMEIVYRIVLAEYRKTEQKDKELEVLKGLVKAFPEDEYYYREYTKLKKDLGIPDKEEAIDDSLIERDKAEETIKLNLVKADLYIEQGLIRNARRILDNLRMSFPTETIIEQKIKELKNVCPDIDRDEIAERVERVTEKESQLFEKKAEEAAELPLRTDQKEAGREVITASDIFSDTDIIPFSPLEGKEEGVFDLTAKVDEELEVIQDFISLQKESGITTFEKPLSEIITDFKKDIDGKLKKANPESRYNLGLAFMEQGLWDEALEEFNLASKDSALAVECYQVMSLCYRRKKDFKEAKKWLDKAIKITAKDPSQTFPLKYELASLYEEMEDDIRAMQVFIEVKEWKSDYRDVNQRLKEIMAKTR